MKCLLVFNALLTHHPFRMYKYAIAYFEMHMCISAKRYEIYPDMHAKQIKIHNFNTLMLILSPVLMKIYYSLIL